eukprot:852328-Pleurochrysis_carterae.AAC.2
MTEDVTEKAEGHEMSREGFDEQELSSHGQRRRDLARSRRLHVAPAAVVLSNDEMGKMVRCQSGISLQRTKAATTWQRAGKQMTSAESEQRSSSAGVAACSNGGALRRCAGVTPLHCVR